MERHLRSFLILVALAGPPVCFTAGARAQSCTPGLAFQGTPRFGVGRSPVSLVTADFNHDGRVDLATANSESGDLSILTGNGDGTFQPERRFGVGEVPGERSLLGSLAAGDLNGDGRLDLAVGERRFKLSGGSVVWSGVLVLLANGEGGFETQRRMAALVSEPPERSLLVVDLNGDGRLDLALDDFPNGVSVWQGNGDGTFQELRALGLEAGFDGPILAADFNGDGWLDLAKGRQLEREIAVLLGSGEGNFQAEAERVYPLGQGYPASMLAADLDGDGRLDLAVAGGVLILAFFGKGDGTFESEPLSVRLPADGATSFLAADLNGDSKLDFAVGDRAGNGVMVLVGNGDRTFLTSGSFTSAGVSHSIVAADMNGDRFPDLAWANDAQNAVSVLLANADGTLQADQLTWVNEASMVIAADLDADGLPDLATANPNASDVSTLLGIGDGTFREERRFPAGGGGNLVAGDMNGDGHLDLATGNAHSDDVSALLGVGDGSFLAQRRFRVGDHPLSLVAGDLDGNGRLDLATANFESDDVSVLLGEGDGTFQEERRIGVARRPGQLVATDLNVDGRLDLATPSDTTDDVSALFGNGDGTFQALRRFPAGRAISLMAADLNGDGRIDLAAGSGSQFTILWGDVDVAFKEQLRFDPSDSPDNDVDPYRVFAEDLNGDGRLDLGAAQTGVIFLILGNGDGTFRPAQLLEVGIGSARYAAADLNGDGSIDLASASRGHTGRSYVLVLLNAPKADCNRNGVPDRCDIEAGSSADLNRNAIPDACEPRPFHRGDSNADGRLDVSDGLCLLGHLFTGDEAPSCLESADANNDGQVDCTDPVLTLGYLFLGTEPPAPPGPPGEPCAPDSDLRGSAADLGCEAYPHCD